MDRLFRSDDKAEVTIGFELVPRMVLAALLGCKASLVKDEWPSKAIGFPADSGSVVDVTGVDRTRSWSSKLREITRMSVLMA